MNAMNTDPDYKLLDISLRLFDPNLNPNVTTATALSDEMKTYYSDYLIDLAEPELVHNQFAQRHPIPRGGGKIIEFRQFDQLPELTTPLSEGVTPDGQSMSVNNITATVSQYGGYVTLSDMLMLTAIDPMVLEATKRIAQQAGKTLDSLTRDVLAAGTNVQYARTSAGTAISSRGALYYTSASDNCVLCVDDIKRAVRTLETQSAPKINGYYIGIVHPHVKYDLMRDPLWQNPHEYTDTENIYTNEIGRLYGVRFVESPRAKVFEKAGKAPTGGTAPDVYATLILADDAYGVTEISGGGLEHIVKQLGSAGTGDPLDQRATVGWKATHVAKILIQQYMVRIESVATP